MKSSHGGIGDISQEAIQLHYQEAPNTIVSQAEEKYLDLLEAVSQGDESRVKELLLMNASLLAKSSRGTTAGGLAAAKGRLNILKMIVEAGVDVNINTTDPWLHQALRNGNFATAEFLIKSGAKLLTRDSRGNARDLEVAQLNILQKMVEAGVDININKSDPWLHQALRNEHITTAKFLIKSGADVDAKSSENQTAFEEAVLRGSIDAISLLHQSGADIHPGNGSRSRLDEAILHGNESWLMLLCEIGVKVGEDSLPATSTRTHFLQMRLDDCMGPSWSSLARFMFDYRAEIYSKSSRENALSISEPRGEKPAVEMLWEYGSNIREMPLSYKEPATTTLSVINYDNVYIVQLLLEERTNPKGRHLWERILFLGSDEKAGIEEGSVIRLLCEWGPISTA
jgi:ankyrin repeat protein